MKAWLLLVWVVAVIVGVSVQAHLEPKATDPAIVCRAERAEVKRLEQEHAKIDGALSACVKWENYRDGVFDLCQNVVTECMGQWKLCREREAEAD